METLAWEVLAPHLTAGTPCLLHMGGTRGVTISYDPLTQGLTLSIPAAPHEALPAKPFEELRLNLAEHGGLSMLEVSTEDSDLYRELHRFGGLLAEDFEQAGRSAGDAFSAAIQRWRSFAALRTPMTAEQQLGLLGELLLLRTLLHHHGPTAVHSWTARTPLRAGRHDFALAEIDIEVKTTRANTREHLVHGLGQLTPAVGRDLFILSLKFEPSGAATGISLPASVADIRDRLTDGSKARQLFETQLRAAGYQDADSAMYLARLRLADRARLVRVDAGCPRLQAPMIADAIGDDLYARISQVDYRVNLDGLGVEEGSPGFSLSLGFPRLHS